MNDDTIEMPAPADALAAIEGKLADATLKGHSVHPRVVYALCEAVPAEERTRVVRDLHAGTKAQALDPRRDSRPAWAVNVVIEARHLAELVWVARPYATPPEPEPEPEPEQEPEPAPANEEPAEPEPAREAESAGG